MATTSGRITSSTDHASAWRTAGGAPRASGGRGSARRGRAPPRPTRAPARPPARGPRSPDRWRTRAGGPSRSTAEHAHGIVRERRRPGRPGAGARPGRRDRPSGPGSLRGPAEQRGEVDGQGVDGDVAPGEVGLEARRAGDRPGRRGAAAGPAGPRGPCRGARRAGRTRLRGARPAGAPPRTLPAGRARSTSRSGRPRRRSRTAPPTSQTGPPDGLQDRAEERPERIGRGERHRGRVSPRRHGGDEAGGGDGAPSVSGGRRPAQRAAILSAPGCAMIAVQWSAMLAARARTVFVCSPR